MYSVKTVLLVVCLTLAGCGGGMTDDLRPSGTDKTATATVGVTGSAVGQNAPDFTLSDTLSNNVTLSTRLASKSGVVLYFAMWCPICNSHLQNMTDNIVPTYPNVDFLVVDYVSGSVTDSRTAQISNGWGSAAFTVLADVSQSALGKYSATMGTTIVINSSGKVTMNEDYKDGAVLTTALEALP